MNTENKTVNNLYQMWLKEKNYQENKTTLNIFINSVLTFQDHYELWLKENNVNRDYFSYEKWINDYCFKNIRSEL